MRYKYYFPDDGNQRSSYVIQEAPSEHINIKVQGQEGSIIHFKIRKSTPFKKLITAYCDRLVNIWSAYTQSPLGR